MLASGWASLAHPGARLGHVGAEEADKRSKMAIKSAKMNQDLRQEGVRSTQEGGPGIMSSF